MKVADLAAELGVPASSVLAQCQRFGIDAPWAGAELTAAEAVRVRVELLGDGSGDLAPAVATLATAPSVPDPEDLGASLDADAAVPEPVGQSEAEPGPGGDDPTVASEPVPPEATTSAAPAAAATDLPPTAVGSLPELAEELASSAEAEADADAPTAATPMPDAAQPGPLQTGTPGGPPPISIKPLPPDQRPERKRRVDRAARTGVLWLVGAVAAFVASNFIENPFAVGALWIAAIVALGFALLDGRRGWRYARMHPDRVRGSWLSMGVLVLGAVGLAGVVLATWAVVRDEPADAAPLSVGELSSVQDLRWGYDRLTTVASHGWRSPAKAEGTCWEADPAEDPRDDGRVEPTNVEVDCSKLHTVEVVRVFTLHPVADAPYPTLDQVVEAAATECGPRVQQLLAKATDPKITGRLGVEYATPEGWDEGDHDVACTIESPTPQRGSAVEQG